MKDPTTKVRDSPITVWFILEKLWWNVTHKFPYQVKVQLVIPKVTDVPKKVLAEFGINPATGRFDNCVDEDLAEDLIRSLLGDAA